MKFAPESVGIAGTGTMGVGIAQVCALAGCKVVLFDTYAPSRETAVGKIKANLYKGVERGKISEERAQGAVDNLQLVTSLEELKADLIIEAVIEDLEVKQKLFSVLESNNENAVLASNTSSIPITKIAATLDRPERFVGIHFFNPAHIMKLVEVISGEKTDPDLALGVREWIIELGKVPVMANDKPGFIVNRVARSFYTESLKQAQEGKATFQGVDRLLEASGFRLGPFKLMDLIGVDTNYSVTTSMYDLFEGEERFKPMELQKEYVDKGWHGKKSGKGFYKYE